MGAQPCSSQQRQKSSLVEFNQQEKQTQDKQNQPNVQFKQQFDNPSRGVVFKCLNNHLVLASNDLLVKQISKSSQKRRQSSNIYDKICQQPTFNNKNTTNRKNKKQQRRCSIDNSFLAQISANSGNWGNMFFLPQNQPIRSIKSYIISQKKLYENYSRAHIKLQDFIKLKKAPIRKHYKFEQKIGEGSYGNVYKAVCVKTNEIRAVKSIKQKIMPQQKKNQFIMQMDILRQLDHPNIIKLYQVFEDKSMYHVVTQYCDGGSIIDFVTSRKKYSQKIVRTIFQQLLTALNYIHMLKIVHRDLKLQNLVFLKTVNQNSQISDIDIKLIDFGTAIRVKSNVNVCKTLVGTASYMAPQIIDGYYNQKCDVWSAGIILYILLVGKSPFKCNNKDETLRKIKDHKLTFTQPQWSNISKLTIDLLQKMLQKNYEKRLTAAQALNHRWFKQIKSGKNLILENKDLVGNLSKYYRGNNFIAKIQSYLTFVKVNQQERKKIAQMFRLLDKNNDGTIQVQELRIAYNAFTDDDQNIDQLEYIVQKIDKNKSGKIDLSQFTAAIYDRRKLFVKQYLEQAFDYFDTDGTGYIQREQLHQLLEGCQKKQIEEILFEIDSNGDNKISKEEFLQYLFKRNFLFTKNN